MQCCGCPPTPSKKAPACFSPLRVVSLCEKNQSPLLENCSVLRQAIIRKSDQMLYSQYLTNFTGYSFKDSVSGKVPSTDGPILVPKVGLQVPFVYLAWNPTQVPEQIPR
ncbi:hypothetical protein AVEN_126581-1 [Araneus ventricosus]|uniref:Uncharacterized protein n=1 Tax=Araneus ventricosus TaxID=182803 RepID=A0A4Y2IAI8_ARAVE|nr:hypothetical protein AVEN_126581-1 [Araneus ventricosus]